MKFHKILPTDQLQPYIKQLIIAENEVESIYKVFPSTGLVLGFQYRGQLNIMNSSTEVKLAKAGITGISDGVKIFKNLNDTGTILVYFTEVGLTYFTATPANELFNQSISLEHIFDKCLIRETEEKLAFAQSDRQRIHVVEQFLLSQLREIENDTLILEAIRMIYESKGRIRIRELNERLFISQSPFEKRFRKVVGTTAKKFTSIVRFNTILDNMNKTKSLTKIHYENDFFDQAHFIKGFKKFTGDTPEKYKGLL